jgi:hypothetical protein
VLPNEDMKIERAHALGAGPYQRTDQSKGYANGFEPRTLHTRFGPLTDASLMRCARRMGPA